MARYGIDYLAIIELKIGEINFESLNQLEDYLKERSNVLKNSPEFWTEVNEPKWIGVLVGSSISPELQSRLMNGFITESGIPIAGMITRRFRSKNGEIFVITDTFFKHNYTSRDYSKFLFMGNYYNKPRLVNQIIKYIVSQKSPISYAELERIIPQRLQGSIGVFNTIENAKTRYDNTGHKRFYIKPDELIELSDTIIATSNQWGINNIEIFVKHINGLNLGNEIKIE